MNVRPGAGRRTLMLVGGDEWRKGMEPADRWYLERTAGSTVTVVTAAAQRRPRQAVEWARRYFAGLGAEVCACLIQTASDAADPGRLEELRCAQAVYLCGGDPGAACRALQGTPAEALILELYRGGVPIAGSSAGAMVLAGSCLVPSEGLRPGLGLVPSALVLPHWNSAAARWRKRTVGIGSDLELLAIDERTALCWDGSRWLALGAGAAGALGPAGELQIGLGRPRPPIE